MNTRLLVLAAAVLSVGPAESQDAPREDTTLRPTWTPYSPAPPTEEARIGLRSGEFFDATFGLSAGRLSGRRAPLPAFDTSSPLTGRGPDVGIPASLDLPLADSSDSGSASMLYVRLAGGYRFEGGWGEVLASVRGVGWEDYRDPKGEAPGLENRASAYALDVGYGNGYSGELPVGVRWSAGGRLGDVFLEDRADGHAAFSSSTTSFLGFGPAGSLSTEWQILGSAAGDAPNLGFYARADGGVLYGRVRQTDRAGQTGPSSAFRYVTQTEERSVPVYGFELGCSVRDSLRRSALMFGYQFEQWAGVGRVGDSRFDLTIRTLFVRVVFNY